MYRVSIATKYDVEVTDLSDEDSVEELIAYLQELGYDEVLVQATTDNEIMELDKLVLETVLNVEDVPKHLDRLINAMLDHSDPDNDFIHLETYEV